MRTQIYRRGFGEIRFKELTGTTLNLFPLTGRTRAWFNNISSIRYFFLPTKAVEPFFITLKTIKNQGNPSLNNFWFFERGV